MSLNPQKSPTPDKTFVFCGGGSGGHLFPAIAVCEELRKRYGERCRFVFLTTGKPVEHEALATAEVATIRIPAVTAGDMRRRPLRSIATLLKSIWISRRLLKSERPAAVIGSGGYGSVPGMLAARSLGLPGLLLEQNVIPGRATMFLSRFADAVCVSFSETTASRPRLARTVETGNPVRRSIVAAGERRSSPEQPALLIMGGSQGAAAINQAMQSIVTTSPALLSGWSVLHLTGTTENGELIAAYGRAGMTATVQPFLAEMSEAYCQSTLVISRAGATTLAELSVLGLPAILIPYPNSVRNHQELNAALFAKVGAAKVVPQTPDPLEFQHALTCALQQVFDSLEVLKPMSDAMRQLAKPQAAARVVDVLERLQRS